MKLNIRIFLYLLLSISGTVRASASDVWARAEAIVAAIRTPSIPDREFNILDFGAVEGGKELCSEAINLAIVTCNQQGGGRVIIPAGRYLTGPITLKSNVDLHLEEEACLAFSTDYSLYFPAVYTRWEGLDCFATHPLIYAYGETNLAVTGRGTIDGQASNDYWWPWNGNPRFGWKPGIASQRGGSRDRLQEQSEQGVPISQRIYDIHDGLRPQMLNLVHCSQVLIEGVTLRNSPFWVIHPLFCQDLTVRGVRIHSLGPNGDGCDPESCRNVLIEDCYFDTGDDCIAIKSGRNADGRRRPVPSENIVIRNCEMKNGHGGVVIGSEISGGYRYLFVENCRMDSPELERVIRIKTNSCRGGVIEQIHVRNIEVGECREAVLKINLDYQPREICCRDYPPVVRDVHLEGIVCGKSRYGIWIVGLRDRVNVRHITLSNCRFDGVEQPFDIAGADDIRFHNLQINGELQKYEPGK